MPFSCMKFMLIFLPIAVGVSLLLRGRARSRCLLTRRARQFVVPVALFLLFPFFLSGACAEEVQSPTFSAKGGFYEEPFLLTLSAGEGESIYYTLDGSRPTANSIRYTEPIQVYDRSEEENVYRAIPNVTRLYLDNFEAPETVDKAFVVRAVCADEEGNVSDTVTQTYFVNLDQYQDRDVISLVVDPEDLFGDQGIYVVGPAYEAWYRDMLAYVEEHAGETSEETYEEYFNEYVDEEEEEEFVEEYDEEDEWYDDDVWIDEDESDEPEIEEVTYPVLPPVTNYSGRGREWEREATAEFFRNGVEKMNQEVGVRIQGTGSRSNLLKRFSIFARKDYSGSKWFSFDFYNDGIPIHSVTLREGFINSFSQALVADRNISTQKSIPVSVFLNGEFWYDTYLQTKYSEKYIAKHYNLSEKNIVILRGGFWSDLTEEELEAYNTTIGQALDTLDLSKEEDYHEFCKIANVQSFIDYSCAHIYLANADVNERKNFMFWRTYVPEDDGYGNGAWNWGLYDMDLLTKDSARRHEFYGDELYNTFSVQGVFIDGPYDEGPIWLALRESPIFCRDFVVTFMDMANTNFSVENVSRMMEAWGEETIDSYDNGFFLYRKPVIVGYMAEEFDLSGSEEPVTLTSNRSGRPVILNTIQPEIPAEGWTGTYFTDYPVTVTAAEEGFLRWEVTIDGDTQIFTEPTLDVPVEEGGVQIRAVYEPTA